MPTINRMRLSGLASGMDTETMVKDLMKVQKMPLDKLKQKKQLEEWKRDTYREMNTLLLEFRDQTTSNLRLQGTFNTKKITSANETKVGAVSAGNPTFSSYVIENVTLSTPSTGASVKFVNNVVNGTTKLSDAGMAASFTFDVKGSDVGAVAKTISVDPADTINDVISKINAFTTDTKVKAVYEESSKSIVFLSTSTGTSSGITISNTSNAANVLNIANGTIDNATNNFGADGVKGSNIGPGSVKINGTTLEITNNTVTYDGIKFSLKESFVGSVTVTVEQDTDAIFDTIKGFVDKYNELIDKLNKKISEPVYRDYQPLLDEERESLDEKQIEKWEEKAKSGVLRRDPLLSKALIDMRKAISTTVSGITNTKFDSLGEIGITTAQASKDAASVNYLENGKLYIDENKLREAISQHGTEVMDIFSKRSTSTDPDTKYRENGVAQRLYDSLSSAIGSIIDTAGTTSSPEESEYYAMGKSMRRINKEMDRWEDRLQRIEDRYWKQFTAMEKALSQMSSQSSWLAQQFT